MRLRKAALFLLVLLLTSCGKDSRPAKAMAIADSLGIRESTDPLDCSALLERSSFNFTLACMTQKRSGSIISRRTHNMPC